MSDTPHNDPSLGDFQTPCELAELVWTAVNLDGITDVIEPTVGLGNFLTTAPARATSLRWYGFDINADHVRAARETATAQSIDAALHVKSAFDLEPHDFPTVRSGAKALVIGNPPWVTNAAQAAGSANNLPQKSNRFRLAGLAAMTGKSNFDIAEAVLLAVVAALRDAAEVRVALLLKRSVALKVAQDVMRDHGAATLSFSRINAQRWFNASVEAGLFQMTWNPGVPSTREMLLYDEFSSKSPATRAGVVRGQFVHRLDEYERVRHVEVLTKDTSMVWRQGIKHDASKVLELRCTPDGLINGLGERVEIEAEALCPLYKSSDIANARPASRQFPLYQFDLTGPVSDLDERWPKLAAYLERHREHLDGRRSRIYAGKPPYMLFGVGPYTAAPYKIGVSGLYKTPRFVVLAPSPEGSPPLVDDTCNLLAFADLDEARDVAVYLNSSEVLAFLSAVTDPAAKRPYTVDVLRRIRDPRVAHRAQPTLDFDTKLGVA